MNLKKSYKILIGLCAILLYVVVNADTSLANLVATIDGGFLDKVIHVIPYL